MLAGKTLTYTSHLKQRSSGKMAQVYGTDRISQADYLKLYGLKLRP